MGIGLGAATLIGAGISGITNLIGGRRNSRAIRDTNNANAALQREFAQKGIQWKVQDAKEAGIHPLFALGANTTQAQPSFVSDSPGDAIASAGRTLGGAVEQLLFRNATESVYSKQLDNELKELQVLDARHRQFMNQAEKQAWRMENDPLYKDMPGNIYNPNNASNPKLYLRGENNYDEAVRWINEGYFPYLNPVMNMETGEIVGPYYFGKPRPEGWLFDRR